MSVLLQLWQNLRVIPMPIIYLLNHFYFLEHFKCGQMYFFYAAVMQMFLQEKHLTENNMD